MRGCKVYSSWIHYVARRERFESFPIDYTICVHTDINARQTNASHNDFIEVKRIALCDILRFDRQLDIALAPL